MRKVYNSKLKAGKLMFLFITSFFIFSAFILAQEEGPPKNTLIPAIKFKDADIKIVLQSIAEKAIKDGERVNIVTGTEVRGQVSVNLEKVDWKTALEAILKAHGYAYEWIGENVILVETLEKLVEKRQAEALAAEQEPLEIVTYKLKFLDGEDIKKVIGPQLTARGRITILEIAPQTGWKARGGLSGEFSRAAREGATKPRSNTIIITDTKSNVRSVLEAIKKIDIMPKQILIEARIMEVKADWIKDIGANWATGSSGVSDGAGNYSQLNVSPNNKISVGGSMLDDVGPSIFDPKAGFGSTITGYNAGMQILMKRLTGTQYELLVHALEEDVNTNTLSAPRILTLDGQEAYIMVGTKRPIIKSSLSSGDNAVAVNQELDYYQNLGIELNVIPKICGDDFVNLIVYPSVTSSSDNVTANVQVSGFADQVSNRYPIIDVRETQTQIILRNNETVAIGGLLKEVKNDSVIKMPFLGDIPYLGKLFQRTTTDTEKIDLIIFLTVRIITPGEIIAPVPVSTETASAPVEPEILAEEQ